MTRELILRDGQITIVNSDIFEKVHLFIWKVDKEGYVCRGGNNRKKKRKRIYLHRFILGNPEICEDKKIADHINGNILDNRRENLRWVTIGQSNCNRKAQGGSSQYKGVSFNTGNGKFRVQIWFNNKKTHGGYFEDELSAAMAYDVLAKELHGEFARLNFPEIFSM